MLNKPCHSAIVATDAARSEQLMTLKGKLLGAPACYTLLDEIRERIQDGLPQVILDMTAVSMINSAGAGILAAIYTSARRKDGSLSLVGLNERSRKVLEFMHLQQFVCFCDTLEQARAAED